MVHGARVARASKDRKGRSISVLSQIEAGRRFFTRHGIVEVVVLIESRAYSGQHHGPIWWGYRKVYDGRTGEATVEIDPVTGPLAAELVARLLASATESGMAREFEERGIACPQEQKCTAVHVRKLYDASLEETSWARLSAAWMPEQREAALEVFMQLKARESSALIARQMNIGEYPHVMPGRWCAAKIRATALNPARAG